MTGYLSSRNVKACEGRVKGYIFCSSRAWQVKMPSHIKGLLGSCLVIPCKFNYHQYPPERPDRVVWYQYVNRGYPVVYDKRYPENVIDIYKRRTYAFTSAYSKTCSLKIQPVMQYDHSQKLYPWVDPENVGRGTYQFWDTSVTIEVVGSISPLTITSTSDEFFEGYASKVTCTATYTCSKHIPTITWNYGGMPVSTDTIKIPGAALWKTVSTLTFTSSASSHGGSLACQARFTGGLIQRIRFTLRVKSKCN
ncbi:sialoadhesin-like [Acanthochromis polyacanthus]|uniref:sialoadhesin-like n=1 Tax=Acanthochromis polyacanthus TaxID=80966 RepID=UPI002234D76E|nr:sialoadhesin-like [Acanthochromis polyacanthus]